ncbi:hypothetical protein BU15DRAFT_73727 [Melanogaster broomeanus]|nr:hypothetical protein BU15DRAFT_73727 [Melanogaster broomeanus]
MQITCALVFFHLIATQVSRVLTDSYFDVCTGFPALRLTSFSVLLVLNSNATGTSAGNKTQVKNGQSLGRPRTLEIRWNQLRVDRYLAFIRAAGVEPTLEDLERCRPPRHSLPESQQYADEYNALMETLGRSFTIWTRSSRRKAEYAESIIEKAWGWPSLKEIERKRRDRTEVIVKTFPVTPSQLFLILGKDGADLLQLSMQYNVRISLTSNPLALRVEGLRGALKELTEHMSLLKKGIIDKIFELPTGRPIRPDLIQRISRLAGAYVESHGNRGKIRICARHINTMKAAERLALRASLEGGTEAQSSTICYNPPILKSESPLVSMDDAPGSTFRIRRVVDWLGVDSYENIAKSGGLADNHSRLLNFTEAEQDLPQFIFGGSTYGQRVVTASLGHLLLPSSDSSQRGNLLPPLKGVWTLPKIFRWVQTSQTPLTFVPSLPPTMMQASPGKRITLHRLVYRTLPQLAGDLSPLPQEILKFEVEFSDSSTVQAQSPASLGGTLTSEDPPSAGEPIFDADFFSYEREISEPVNPHSEVNMIVSNPCCQVGKETLLNLMMPDRPMDLQFSIFDYTESTVAGHPIVLREYVEKLCDFASSGSKICWNLRQSNDLITISTSSGEGRVEDSVKVYSESIVDFESNQKMELCKVKFDGTAEDPKWKHFLAACDQLSAVPLQSRSKNEETQADYLEE